MFKKIKFTSFAWITVILSLVIIAILFIKIKGVSLTINIPQISQSSPSNSLDNTNINNAYSVMLLFNPTNICVGEYTTGSISSNMPGAVCTIFADSGNGYKFIMNVVLDNNGAFSTKQVINQAGTAKFKSICCDSNGLCKISSEAYINVNNCNQPYQQYTCIDSDGGINYQSWGYCEDNYHNAGFQDTCDNGYIKEYYCDDDGICQNTHGGSCQSNNQMPCESIIPSGQETCSDGYCSSGTCKYIPATLITKARCECG